jgi:hypothetical protein
VGRPPSLRSGRCAQHGVSPRRDDAARSHHLHHRFADAGSGAQGGGQNAAAAAAAATTSACGMGAVPPVLCHASATVAW